MNALAEIFVPSMKSECLDRMTFAGGDSLNRPVREFTIYCHAECPHHGIENAGAVTSGSPAPHGAGRQLLSPQLAPLPSERETLLSAQLGFLRASVRPCHPTPTAWDHRCGESPRTPVRRPSETAPMYAPIQAPAPRPAGSEAMDIATERNHHRLRAGQGDPSCERGGPFSPLARDRPISEPLSAGLERPDPQHLSARVRGAGGLPLEDRPRVI